MFDKLKGQFKQWQTARRLMQDKDFQALMGHPKVQEAFNDPEVRAAITAKNFGTLTSNPTLLALLRDPEVARLFTKLDPSKLSA